MDQLNSIRHLLDLMSKPAFCVQDDAVIHINHAAHLKQIDVGISIFDLILDNPDAYREFHGGCLYLTIQILGIPCGASVTRTEGFDIFILEDTIDVKQLEALSLAAQQLRIPLSNLMAVTQAHFYEQDLTEPNVQKHSQQVNRGLYQLHRIINNMADAAYWGKDALTEVHELDALFSEVMEAIAFRLQEAGILLHFTGLNESVYSLADRELLERAIYNLVSNAAKFTPKDGVLEATLTKYGSQLRFSIQGQLHDSAEEIPGDAFRRYLRQPGVEDSRFGVGLGMVLVRSAAAAHNGTVLIDQPDSDSVRVTMTLAIQQATNNTFRSPCLHISDYAGGRDRGLLELADILPLDSYSND